MKCWSAGCNIRVKFDELKEAFLPPKCQRSKKVAVHKSSLSLLQGLTAFHPGAGSKPEILHLSPWTQAKPDLGCSVSPCFQFLLEVEKGSFQGLLVWIKVKSETRLLLIANAFGLSVKIMQSHSGFCFPGSWHHTVYQGSSVLGPLPLCQGQVLSQCVIL